LRKEKSMPVRVASSRASIARRHANGDTQWFPRSSALPVPLSFDPLDHSKLTPVEDVAYDADVAVSFAGEQREYVEEFVRECQSRGLNVLYDRDMTLDLWGKNLIFEFRKIYGGSQPRFVVPFISKEYLAKPYPMDEFAAAVEQSFRRAEVYILPVVVGDVAPPRELLNPATGYLEADAHSPAQLAEMVVAKVGRPTSAAATPFRAPRIAPTSFDPRSMLVSAIRTIGERFERDGPSALEPYGYVCRVLRESSGVDVRVEQGGQAVCSLSLWFNNDSFLGGPERLAMSFGWPTNGRRGMNGWIEAVWDREHRTAALKFFDFGAGGTEQLLSVDEFGGVLWNKIVDLVERRVV
jgi:hypothetical protein